jgi:hypothetical protein
MKWEILLLDLKRLFMDIRPQDLGPMIFWMIWSVALFSSLKGVDRRDEIAQVTYMGCLLALGAVVILSLPLGSNSTYGSVGKVVVFMVLLLCSSVRWMYVKKVSPIDLARRAAMADGTKNKK